MSGRKKEEIKRKDVGPETAASMRVCKEVSVKEICVDCERTCLYPEENYGCPTTLVVCEEVLGEASGMRKKQEAKA